MRLRSNDRLTIRIATIVVALEFAFGTLIQAADDPQPFSEFRKEMSETAIVEALGLLPPGKIPVAVYKRIDFVREILDTAIEHEDKSLGADLVMINADAALLHGLHAKGISFNSDPRALAAKNRLSKFVERNRVAGFFQRDIPYAVVNVGLQKSISKGLGWFLARSGLGKWILRIFPIGDEVRDILGHKSALKPVLRYAGWQKFGERAELSSRYVDKLTEKMLESQIDFLVEKKIKGIVGVKWDDIVRDIEVDHPSHQVFETRVRLVFVREPDILPAAVLPIAATAPADPIARAISNDDHFSQRYTVSTSNTTASSTLPTKSANAPAEAPQSKFHDELIRVGDGKTGWKTNNDNNKGSWDGKKGQGLKN